MRFHVRADTARPSRVCWARVRRSRALNRRPGNRGRLDEAFIHSVRSQLPIRGKYLDHHGSVEALVDGRRWKPADVGLSTTLSNSKWTSTPCDYAFCRSLWRSP